MSSLLVRNLSRTLGPKQNVLTVTQGRLTFRGCYCNDADKSKASVDKQPKEEKASPSGSQKRLQNLLTNLKTVGSDQARAEAAKEPNLAKPKQAKLAKRDKKGQYKATNLQEIGLDPKLVEATNVVSSKSKKSAKTKSDLLRKLQSIAVEAKQARAEDVVAGEDASASPVADLFSDLKVEKTLKKPVPVDKQPAMSGVERRLGEDQKKQLTAEQIAFLEKRARLRRQQAQDRRKGEDLPSVNLFGGQPLGILTAKEDGSPAIEAPCLNTWKLCAERELKVLTTPAPRNALDEMILWTEQGKLWQFPIDNEQGLDYSSDPFHKHVFLEHHLESWCPQDGPVRHFMDLVCVGLSKNPYMTSQKKLETIIWFKDYFEKPEVIDLLRHQGVWHEDAPAEALN